MQEYWENYMKPVDGFPAQVAFNAQAIDDSSSGEYMYVGFVKLFLKSPSPDGFLQPQEQEIVAFIEDNIELEALRYRVGKYVGRIMSQGSINFIYYLKFDFEWPSAINDAMQRFSEYSYEFGSRIDTDWEVYKKLLYPSVKEWQMIHNRFTCKHLLEAGDSLEKERAIEHRCYFDKPDMRENYKHVLKNHGFIIQTDLEHEKLYGVQFYKIDAPLVYTMDELTFFLIESAKEHGGEYDGWETSIVK
jgi:hypothetical protein